jgi:hypothetical protein
MQDDDLDKSCTVVKMDYLGVPGANHETQLEHSKSFTSSHGSCKEHSRTINSLLMNNLSAVSQSSPITITFHQLSYRVPVSRRLSSQVKRLSELCNGIRDGSKTGTEKMVLRSFSGCIKSGELLAIMGRAYRNFLSIKRIL